MEEKQESEQRTERDKHSGGMEIEPTMKWRLRNMELRQGGSGGGRGGTESLFLETGKLHTAKNILSHWLKQKHKCNLLRQI